MAKKIKIEPKTLGVAKVKKGIIRIVPLTKKDLAKATPAQREVLKGAAKLVIEKAKAAKDKLVKNKPFRPEPPLTAMLRAGIKKIIEKHKADDKDAAAAWVDADEQLKKEGKTKSKAKAAHPPSALPVESDKPGIARNPKPPKVIVPLAADGAIVPLEIISYHFLKLMERLAAEHGGTSAQALADLKADIAKRKTP